MASITLSDVSVQFPLYQGGGRSLKKSLLALAPVGSALGRDKGRVHVNALQDISITIEHGDRVGLIGHNGAGKTTLLRVLAGVYEPMSGVIQTEGNVSALLDVSLGLDPDATGYENITLRGLYMGFTLQEIRALTPSIAEFTELGDYLHMPVRTYSTGMTLRLAFAAVTAAKPEILLMDEWLLAGDAQFLNKAHHRIDEFVRQSHILVLASHSRSLLEKWCTKIIWMEHGCIRAIGTPDDLLPRYFDTGMSLEVA